MCDHTSFTSRNYTLEQTRKPEVPVVFHADLYEQSLWSNGLKSTPTAYSVCAADKNPRDAPLLDPLESALDGTPGGQPDGEPNRTVKFLGRWHIDRGRRVRG